MKLYSYVDPVGDEFDITTVVMNEKEILEQYWDWWCEKMRSVGLEAEINEQKCIEDWCISHWAIPEQIYKLDGRYFIANQFMNDDRSTEYMSLICVSDPNYETSLFYSLDQLEEVDEFETN